MTEIERYDATTVVVPNNAEVLAAQMDYARAIAVSNLLPQAYRQHPENVLVAMGLGEAMGLSPTESMYRINVIQGTPTASAELIAANVRKAGHKLRLRVDEANVSATCTIIRADDPDYEHVVTRDKAWAQQMGLLNKDNYKKQPATMLGWRAITACARQACPEALYGVTYTADEMGDMQVTGTVVRSSTSSHDRVRAAIATPQTSGSAEAVDHPAPEPPTATPDAEPDPITKAQSKKLHATFNELGMTDRDERMAFTAQAVGRDVESSNDLTKSEAASLIDTLEAEVAMRADGGPVDADAKRDEVVAAAEAKGRSLWDVESAFAEQNDGLVFSEATVEQLEAFLVWVSEQDAA